MNSAGTKAVSGLGRSRGDRPYVRWSHSAVTSGPRAGAGGLCWAGVWTPGAVVDVVPCGAGAACTTGGVPSPPIGPSPGLTGGTGAVPLEPGVSPVDAGTCGAVLAGAVGSRGPLAALVTAVAIVAAATGRSGSGIDGIVGGASDLDWWCCPVGWCPCCWPVGVFAPEVLCVPEPVEVEGAAVLAPCGEIRLASVGFIGCGVLGVLGVSAVVVAVARGISGRWTGSGAGDSPDASW